jgi:two-component system response regulator HydG
VSETAFILIVEDEEAHGQAVAEGLKRSGHACRLVAGGKDAIESVRQRPPDVVVTDYRLGGDMDGMDVLRQTKRLCPDAEVVLITAHGDERLAREALRPDAEFRAYDYLAKPLDIEEVRAVVERAARQALTSKQNRVLREQLDKHFSFSGILGASEAMARIVRILQRIADSKITVLLEGESGVGKDLIARAIHTNSSRASKRFLPINCAGLNENLLESELFGHVRGSFTGAVVDRKGLFAAADGGTVFLDEIGDMPLTMQAKLLRVLESGEIVPVGSNDAVQVDVRVVAATNRALRDLVAERDFREDLFHRLNQIILRIPPLRERRDDIPLLASHFLEQANHLHDKNVNSITPEAVRKLTNYKWEGNVRQLKAVIEQMVVLTDGNQLDVDDLPPEVRGSTELVPLQMTSAAALTMAEVEKMHIANTLRLVGGNRERAAKVLGIGVRTLYRKLKDFGLD